MMRLTRLWAISNSARADMQTIQATLFLNVFGRLMSTYDDHEKVCQDLTRIMTVVNNPFCMALFQAHILYPAFLTMYRRSALFNTPHSAGRSPILTQRSVVSD